jgi:hypothetical protein
MPLAEFHYSNGLQTKEYQEDTRRFYGLKLNGTRPYRAIFPTEPNKYLLKYTKQVMHPGKDSEIVIKK